MAALPKFRICGSCFCSNVKGRKQASGEIPFLFAMSLAQSTWLGPSM